MLCRVSQPQPSSILVEAIEQNLTFPVLSYRGTIPYVMVGHRSETAEGNLLIQFIRLPEHFSSSAIEKMREYAGVM